MNNNNYLFDNEKFVVGTKKVIKKQVINRKIKVKCEYCGAMVDVGENNTCPQCGASISVKHIEASGCGAVANNSVILTDDSITETNSPLTENELHQISKQYEQIRKNETKKTVWLLLGFLAIIFGIIFITNYF